MGRTLNLQTRARTPRETLFQTAEDGSEIVETVTKVINFINVMLTSSGALECYRLTGEIEVDIPESLAPSFDYLIRDMVARDFLDSGWDVWSNDENALRTLCFAPTLEKR